MARLIQRKPVTKTLVTNQQGFLLIETILAMVLATGVVVTVMKSGDIAATAKRVYTGMTAKSSMNLARDFLVQKARIIGGTQVHYLLPAPTTVITGNAQYNGLPLSIPVNANDEFGTPYLYCAWDTTHANVTGTTYNGYASDQTAPPSSGLVGRLISAGSDKTFSTSCSNSISQSDDIVLDIYESTVFSANGGIGGWQYNQDGQIPFVGLLNPNSRLGLGTTPTSEHPPTHRLELPGGTTVTEGIALGDVEIFRSGDNSLAINGSLQVNNGSTELFSVSGNGSIRINGKSGDSKQVLMSNGPNSAPTWTDPANGGSITIEGDGTITKGTWHGSIIETKYGGTGVDASDIIDGQLLIGKSTGIFNKSFLTGTVNQVNITNGPGSITLSLPQDIEKTSTPIFGGLTLNGNLNMAGQLLLNGNAGTSGYVLTSLGPGLAPAWNPANTGSFTDDTRRNLRGGTAALAANTSGYDNIAIGYNALTNNSSSSNTALGSYAGYTDSTGSNNLFLGYRAGYYQTGSNTIVLDVLDRKNASGESSSSPIFITTDASTANQSIKLNGNVTVNGGLILGGPLMANNSVGTTGLVLASQGAGLPPAWKDLSAQMLQEDALGNLKGGTGALANNSTGTYNLALGYQALNQLTGVAPPPVTVNGNMNVAMGYKALALGKYVTGSVAIGPFTMNNVEDTTARTYNNVAIGQSALTGFKSGNGNTVIGNQALTASGSFSSNTVVGNAAGPSFFKVTTPGSNNLFLGFWAGYYETGSGTIILDVYSRSDKSNQAANAPIYITASTNGAASQTIKLNGNVAISNNLTVTGGTSTFADLNLQGKLLLGSGNSAGTLNQVLTSQGPNLPPIWKDATGNSGTWQGNVIGTQYGGTGLDASGVTDGKLLIGKSTGSFALSTLTGTADQVTVTNGPGSIILSLPQSIASTSSPTFAGLTLNGPLTANSSVGTSGYALVSQGAGLSPTWKDLLGSGSTWQGNVIGTQYGGTGLSITSAANGQLLIGNGTGFSINSLAGTTDQITVTNGPGSITLSLPQSIATTSSPIFAGLTLKGALTLNNSVATSGYVLTANGPGISPVWQDISAQTLQEDGNGNIKGGTGALASITSGAGVYNLALGHNALNKLTGTVNNGYYNIALGSNALTAATTATQSIAIGYNALASQLSGSGNLAIGESALALNKTGTTSIAIGTQALYNNTKSYNTAIGYASGRGNVSGSNNLYLGYYTGYYESSGSGTIILDVYDRLSQTGQSNNAPIYITANSGGAASQTIRLNGNVIISNNLTVASLATGSVTATNGVLSTSDRRFKKNIISLTSDGDIIAKVKHLTGVYYDWRRDQYPERGFSTGRQIGFIAQDVEQVFPELVATDAKGFKSLSYDKLTAVLVEVAKAQQQQLDNHERRISTTEADIDQIRQKELTSLRSEVSNLREQLKSQGQTHDKQPEE